jgi:DNA adenine methylase
MRYMGGKVKLFNEIFAAINATINISDFEYWIEPFVGGCNFIDKISNIKRIGNDKHKHLICMFKHLENGWIPPDYLSEEEYLKLKELSKNDIDNPLIGFAGFCCSFGGKFFGGYARNKTHRNYAGEGKRALIKQAPLLKDVQFYNLDYKELIIPNNSIVYCDPPYANSTKYKCDFNHEEFWDYCNKLTKRNIKVFVSEYSAPNDWKCIWQKEVFSNIRRKNKERKFERLFHKEG